MAVQNLGGGRFKIFHKEVAAPTAEMEALRNYSATTESPVSGFLNGTFHASAFKQLRAFVQNSDSEWLRQQLMEHDTKLAEVADRAKVVETLSKADATARDTDLTPEAAKRRAMVILASLLDDVHARHSPIVGGAMADLVDAVALVKMAVAPELSGNEQVREMRAQEIRRAIFDTDKGDRAALVLDLGNRAALEGLLAVESCPLGRVVEPEVLSQAKRAALSAMEVDFLLDAVASRRDVLASLAARCDMIENAIRDFLSAYGVKPAAPVSWTVATASAIKDSETFL